MLTAAAAALPIISGTASGETCLGPLLEQQEVVGLDRADAADAGADDGADLRGVIGQLLRPAGIREGLDRGDKRELREAVGATGLLDREVLGGGELAAAALAVRDPADARRPSAHAARARRFRAA